MLVKIPIQLDANTCSQRNGWRGCLYNQIHCPFFIVHHEFSKGMGQFEDESLTSHCQNAGIVFNVEL